MICMVWGSMDEKWGIRLNWEVCMVAGNWDMGDGYGIFLKWGICEKGWSLNVEMGLLYSLTTMFPGVLNDVLSAKFQYSHSLDCEKCPLYWLASQGKF